MPRARNTRVSLSAYSEAARPDLKWAVRWPSSEAGGRRMVRRFEKKSDAKAFKEQKEIDLLNKGAERASIHSDGVEDAKWAIEALAPYGVSIREAISAYIARHEEIAASVPVPQAVKEFLEAKDHAGVSPRYRADMRLRLVRFEKTFGKRIVGEITTKDLSRWLEKLGVGPVTRNNYRRNLGVFFGWCERVSYVRTNPIRLTERAKKRPEPVEIFTAGELRVILSNAPAELVPALALGAFAGLRVSEISGLDWKEINFLKGHIEVAAEIAKTASRRFVPMPPALIAWLMPHALPAGPISPNRLNERLSAYRATIDKEAVEDGVVIRPAVPWKDNGLRHSFASYAIAKEESADRVALWLGHTSAKITFEHYQERATMEDALAWFDVMPADQSRKVAPFRAKKRKTAG